MDSCGSEEDLERRFCEDDRDMGPKLLIKYSHFVELEELYKVRVFYAYIWSHIAVLWTSSAEYFA